LVPKEHKKEIAYGVSNGQVADDSHVKPQNAQMREAVRSTILATACFKLFK